MGAENARPLQDRREGKRVGLVLSGGGARGAYEVGVLQHVFGPLARRLGFTPRIDIYAGASVGAVHCCYMAAHADQVDGGTEALHDIWRAMSFSRVYRFGVSDAMSFAGTLLGSLRGSATESERHPDRLHGMLNTTPLEQLVIEHIPWRRLRRNVRDGRFEALCVSTTEVATGRTVVFVDNLKRSVDSWTRDPLQVAVPARILPQHPLASAAIPLLFPAVRIGDTYFADGSLRQHTPLTPALRLGANRLLIIGLRAPETVTVDARVAVERIEQFRSAGFLIGKVLNALLIDRLEYDVAHMRVLNEALRAGVEACGPDHLEHINPKIKSERGLGFQIVEECFVRPSEDIGVIAAGHVRRLNKQREGSWIGNWTFRALTRGAPEDEADFMSYLLFDGGYAQELMELGRSDAARSEDALAALFTD